MKLFRAYSKDIRNLYLAVLLAFILAGYVFSIFFIGAVRQFLNPALHHHLMPTALTGLIILTGLLLLLSYIRLKRVSMDTAELHNKLKEMNQDVVLVVNPKREIVMCNEVISAMFGYSPEEVMNCDTSLLYKDRRSADGDAIGIREQLERLGFHHGFAVGIQKDGTEFPLEINTGKLRGRPGAVLQIRDASEIAHFKKTDRMKSDVLRELEYSVKKLKETEASRDALAQMIVHDMKTPLQVITGNLELLEKQEGHLAPDDHECVQKALEQSQRLVGMVEDILQVSRMEGGKLSLAKEKIDFRTLVQSAVEDIDTLLGERTLNVNPADDELPVHVDPDLIHRVLNNLLSNAMTHGGEKVNIRIKVSRKDGYAYFEIHNDGPSIPTENRDQIFEKYIRFESGVKADSFSTGLGLSFCKLALEAHGGKIGLGAPTNGAAFWFTLPLKG